MVIYILRYNSYFNRIVKKEDNLSDYLNNAVYSESQLNFNPGDGCDTQFVAGRQGNPYDGSGDYLIYSEDNTTITSRWFIINQTRNLKGQYSITLHRDVLVDSYDDVINADMFIESAIVKDSDPTIYNSEPIIVNQIKQKEEMLKDKTGCPWIVGYFDKTGEDKTIKVNLDYNYDEIIDDTFPNWISKYKTYNVALSQGFKFTFKWKLGVSTIDDYITYVTDDGASYYESTDDYTGGYVSVASSGSGLDLMISKLGQEFIDNKIFTDLWNINYTTGTKNTQYAGKVLRFNTDIEGQYLYKKISIKRQKISFEYQMTYASSLTSTAYTKVLKNHFTLNTTTGYPQTYYGINMVYTVLYEDVTPGNYQANFTPTKKVLASDAPYGIFAIPYGNIKVNNIDCEASVGMSWAMKAYELAGGTSNSYIYDLQLLPYCPCPGWINSDGSITVKNDKQYTVISEYDSSGAFVKNRSIIIYPNSQSFTLDIDYSIKTDNKKISSVCDVVRLVSPNYNGQFEFTPAKNNDVSKFNVDCTYLPFNPYIHINPDFGGLYGTDFNDARGLICQGDFSLPVMNDAWISYQNSNKNYQNIFNRQIENMEVNRKYQLVQESFDRIAGTVEGFSNGVKTGSKIGGATGGLVGGILGASTSFIGGQIDKQISEGLYNESISYMKDNFALQLGNIQAQPQSIGKTTAFTYNNKIFPIVEHYTCTPEEKQYVANKIIYNSMNVGVVGKLKHYVNNTWTYNNEKSKGFIKGKLLHADIEQDSHYLATVSKELQLGGYYTWE